MPCASRWPTIPRWPGTSRRCGHRRRGPRRVRERRGDIRRGLEVGRRVRVYPQVSLTRAGMCGRNNAGRTCAEAQCGPAPSVVSSTRAVSGSELKLGIHRHHDRAGLKPRSSADWGVPVACSASSTMREWSDSTHASLVELSRVQKGQTTARHLRSGRRTPILRALRAAGVAEGYGGLVAASAKRLGGGERLASIGMARAGRRQCAGYQ